MAEFVSRDYGPMPSDRWTGKTRPAARSLVTKPNDEKPAQGPVHPPDWSKRALCVGDWVLFDSDGTWEERPKWRKAIAICDTCPVKRECLADAMQSEAGETTRTGIRGGLTPPARKRLARDGRCGWCDAEIPAERMASRYASSSQLCQECADKRHSRLSNLHQVGPPAWNLRCIKCCGPVSSGRKRDYCWHCSPRNTGNTPEEESA